MRIVLLGPVTTKSYFGGVAIFDENLALAFKSLGHKVVVVTNQKDEHRNREIDVIYKDVLHTSEFINTYIPDVVIASLSYAKYLPYIKCSRKIYYLHGFFNMSFYGQMKSNLGLVFQKLFLNNSIEVVANSSLTKLITEDIFNLRVDRTVPIGVSNLFIDCAKTENEQTARKENMVLYAGRLVKAKNVDKVIRAFHRVQKDAKLVIAGDGDELTRLKRLSKGNSNIKFVGQLSQEELYNYYKISKVFISLNPSEPYGMSYAEALLLKNNIVCPNSGGQVDFLRPYEGHVSFVDIDNINMISHGIETMLNVPNIDKFSEQEFYSFSYERTARQLLIGNGDNYYIE